MQIDLYTVIVEFKGGTYIGQTESLNAHSALNDWLTAQSDEDLKIWKLERTLLSTQIEEQQPILLEGAVNVWCFTATLGDDSFLANIVRTKKDLQ